jgi:hypothetical protein
MCFLAEVVRHTDVKVQPMAQQLDVCSAIALQIAIAKSDRGAWNDYKMSNQWKHFTHMQYISSSRTLRHSTMMQPRYPENHSANLQHTVVRTCR